MRKPDLKDKTILITGGTSGIGKETVLALAKMDGTVIFTSRDRQKGEETKREVIESSNNKNIDYFVCDLSSFESINKFAEEFKKKYPSLKVLINNAGVLPQDRVESKDGIELNFAVNFLAPFLLTNLLLPIIKKSTPARIINVSSSLHKEGKINFDDIEGNNFFDKYTTYGNSKLAILLFTKKLAKDLIGSGITVNALHPGVVGTRMTLKNIENMNKLVKFFYSKTLLTPKDGAKTSVYLASSPEVENVTGEYFEGCKISEPSERALDMDVAERLWREADKIISGNLR